MAEPLSAEVEQACATLAARIAAELAGPLGMSFEDARLFFAALLRHQVDLRTRPPQDAPEPMTPQQRTRITRRLADARALIDTINDPAEDLTEEVVARLAQHAIPLSHCLIDMIGEADRLEGALHAALARPWEVFGPRLFNDLVDVIERDDEGWDAQKKASAILSVLTLKRVVVIDQSRDLRRAEERVRKLERGVTDVWAALKEAPKLAVVKAAARGDGFTVELWEDGSLTMTAPVDGEALRPFLQELRQDLWFVVLEWRINGQPTPERFPAEQAVTA